MKRKKLRETEEKLRNLEDQNIQKVSFKVREEMPVKILSNCSQQITNELQHIEHSMTTYLTSEIGRLFQTLNIC